MKKTVIFGCGQRGLRLLQLFRQEGKTVDFFCDSDPQKQGKDIQGIPCVPLASLHPEKENLVCYISPLQQKAVFDRLQEQGFPHLVRWDEVDFWTEKRKKAKISTNTPHKKVIVSFTSYPQRIPSLHLMVETLFAQQKQADEIILWLSKEQFPRLQEDLTEDLRACVKRGLSVRFVEGDMKSHKKYLYALEAFPEALILTVDDDILYHPEMIATLYASYLKFPHGISCSCCRIITFQENHQVNPYPLWMPFINYHQIPAYHLCPIGYGGVLYPPNSLHPDVQKKELIRKSCLETDDLWLKFMSLRQNTPVILADKHRPTKDIPGSQENKLNQENILWRNDQQLQNILALYPEEDFYHLCQRDEATPPLSPVTRQKERRGTPMNHIKISAIVPVYNVAPYLRACLDSLLGQTLEDIEIICVDDGSTDDSLSILREYEAKDRRIILRTQENQGVSVARNNGLSLAQGEYLSFVDSDDYFDKNAFSALYTQMKQDDLQVLLFGFADFADENSPHLAKTIRTPAQTPASPVQTGLALFTTQMEQNQYHGEVWHKLFQRSFCQEQEISFMEGVTMNEDDLFSFQALLSAPRSKRISEVFYYRRLRKDSAWHLKPDYDKVQSVLCVYLELLKFTQNKPFSPRESLQVRKKIYYKRREFIQKYRDYSEDTGIVPMKTLQNLEALFYDEPLTLLTPYNPELGELLFFGAGKKCRSLLTQFQEQGLPKPVAICDNSPTLQGTLLEGIPILSLDEALTQFENPSFLISNSLYEFEIYKQLEEKVKKSQILCFYS